MTIIPAVKMDSVAMAKVIIDGRVHPLNQGYVDTILYLTASDIDFNLWSAFYKEIAGGHIMNSRVLKEG